MTLEERMGNNIISVIELLKKGSLEPLGEKSAKEWAMEWLMKEYEILIDKENEL